MSVIHCSTVHSLKKRLESFKFFIQKWIVHLCKVKFGLKIHEILIFSLKRIFSFYLFCMTRNFLFSLSCTESFLMEFVATPCFSKLLYNTCNCQQGLFSNDPWIPCTFVVSMMRLAYIMVTCFLNLIQFLSSLSLLLT